MKDNSYFRFSFLTLIALYLLILVGGIVRATGSGMGCPDWPKCFGKLVPPTSLDQLPSNYKEVYAEKRKQKNLRIANLLDKFGYKDIHDAIINDPSVYVEEDFNPVKTWIEYINRLLGALIGVFIAVVVLLSLKFWKTQPSVVWLSIGALVLTLIQAFLGSIVVSTNLIPATITLHMLFALLMVGFLLFAMAKVSVLIKELKPTSNEFKMPMNFIWFNLVLALIQVVLGTQVRETVDVIKDNNDVVGNWQLMLEGANHWLEIHRIFAFVVLSAGLFLFLRLRQKAAGKFVNFAVLVSFGTLVFSVISGIVLAYVGLPAFMQPVHLTLGSVLAGAYFALLAFGYQLKVNQKVVTTAS